MKLHIYAWYFLKVKYFITDIFLGTKWGIISNDVVEFEFAISTLQCYKPFQTKTDNHVWLKGKIG